MKQFCINHYLKLFLVPIVAILTGCAASSLPNYQTVYQGYNVPDTLVQEIKSKFQVYGLKKATVKRDMVGRIQLDGTYENEKEVSTAFVISYDVVGEKAVSPFYPTNIIHKDWEIAAEKSLREYIKCPAVMNGKEGVKRALIIGINEFEDIGISRIEGEIDAIRVYDEATRSGYQIVKLFGKNATKNNIETEVRKLSNILRCEDTLFIYISSHGVPPIPGPKNDRKMSIIAYDTNKSNAISVYSTSVSDSIIQELANKPTRNTNVILDTCFSGNTMSSYLDSSPESKKYKVINNTSVKGSRSPDLVAWGLNEGYASKGIVFASEAEMKSASSSGITSVNKKVWDKNYTMIVATSEGQHSWTAIKTTKSPTNPNERMRGSFFTQSFLDYLKIYNGDVSKAFNAARNWTDNEAKKIPEAHAIANKEAYPVNQTARIGSNQQANFRNNILNP